MAKKKIVIEPTFEKTCDLIYSLASARIKQKYEEWKKNQPYSRAIIDFYPSDRKLFSNVLKAKKG